MGRLHTPTAVLEARGSYLNHPERARPNEPRPTRPLGSPPKDFSENQARLWQEFKGMVVPGVAYYSDRWALVELVRLKEKSDLGTITEAAANRLLNMMGRFGLTPADRAKIQVEAGPENKLAKFLMKPKANPATLIWRPGVANVEGRDQPTNAGPIKV
jgi:hypothetical protein